MTAEDLDLIGRVERQIAADVGMSLDEWRRWALYADAVLPRYSSAPGERPERPSGPVVRCTYCGQFSSTVEVLLFWLPVQTLDDGRQLVAIAPFCSERCEQAAA
jgi:hypothetical protein